MKALRKPEAMKLLKKYTDTVILEADVYALLPTSFFNLSRTRRILGVKPLDHVTDGYDCGARAVYQLNKFLLKYRKKFLGWSADNIDLGTGGGYGSGAPALPVGLVKYKDTQVGWHIINIAICEDNEVIFFERKPTSAGRAYLNEAELKSISYIIFP